MSTGAPVLRRRFELHDLVVIAGNIGVLDGLDVVPVTYLKGYREPRRFFRGLGARYGREGQAGSRSVATSTCVLDSDPDLGGVRIVAATLWTHPCAGRALWQEGKAPPAKR